MGLPPMIPGRIRDLLVREAHLHLGREAIAPVLVEHESRLQEWRARKPGLFASAATKAAHTAEGAELEEALALLRTGIAQLDRVEPHIRRLVLEAAEDHCREHHPDYLRALAIRERRADWDRCLQRFAEKLYGFTQALGNARNMATSGYHWERQNYSQSTLQAFLLAIQTGRQVEDEVTFANDIVDVQQSLLAQASLPATALPKLRAVNFSQWVAMISNLPLAEAQVQFDEISADAKKLSDETLPQLYAQAQLADASQSEALHGYVMRVLESLRGSIGPFVNPDDTEANVADSERMLAELARNSVLGRLPT